MRTTQWQRLISLNLPARAHNVLSPPFPDLRSSIVPSVLYQLGSYRAGADVGGVAEELLVVGAHVQGHGQALLRRHPTKGRVQRDLACTKARFQSGTETRKGSELR